MDGEEAPRTGAETSSAPFGSLTGALVAALMIQGLGMGAAGWLYVSNRDMFTIAPTSRQARVSAQPTAPAPWALRGTQEAR